MISMTPLKSKAMNIPEPVKSLVLSEPDSIDSMDFITKLGKWERLLKMEVHQR